MPASSLPDKLLLPEAAAILEDRLDLSQEESRGRLERAIRHHSLREIVTLDPADGRELSTDVTEWRDIDWDSGIVMIEPSWSGSPVTCVPIQPLLGRDEFLRVFDIDARPGQIQVRDRGGRPPRYDWEAFWVEICCRVYKEELPETRAEIVRKMESWFADRGQENIDKRTIEKKLSKLYAALNKD